MAFQLVVVYQAVVRFPAEPLLMKKADVDLRKYSRPCFVQA